MNTEQAGKIEAESIEYARKNARDTYSFYNNELDLEAAYHAGRTKTIEEKDERINDLEEGVRFILNCLPQVETMAVSKAKQLLNNKH